MFFFFSIASWASKGTSKLVLKKILGAIRVTFKSNPRNVFFPFFFHLFRLLLVLSTFNSFLFSFRLSSLHKMRIQRIETVEKKRAYIHSEIYDNYDANGIRRIRWCVMRFCNPTTNFRWFIFNNTVLFLIQFCFLLLSWDISIILYNCLQA